MPMSDQSAVLGLPFIQPAQAQKHVTHNEALRILDIAVQLAVQSRVQSLAPEFPDPGQRWIVAAGGTGLWAGQDGRIALWDDWQWHFFAPLPGWRAHVLDEGVTVVFGASGWVVPPLGVQSLAQLGIATAADDTNRLAIASAATLLTHPGSGGHQLKINKAGAAQTASVLFQSGWAGRAEMGLTGNNDFTVKTSADGSNWVDGLVVARANGAVSAPQGLDAGALGLNGSPVYARSNLLGSVGQVGGVPTGAVIERGSNANGEFVRFADGTQICVSAVLSVDITTAFGAIFAAPANLEVSMPAAFFTVTGSAVSVCAVNAENAWGAGRMINGTTVRWRAFRPNAGSANTFRLATVGRWF
jgi:hypothetical protein